MILTAKSAWGGYQPGNIVYRAELREYFIRQHLTSGRRSRFRNLAGNEIAPAGMPTGCPADCTITDILASSSWVKLSDMYPKWFRVLPKMETPTAIVRKDNTVYTAISGRYVYLGECEEWLTCVVDRTTGMEIGPVSHMDGEEEQLMDLEGIETPPTPPMIDCDERM